MSSTSQTSASKPIILDLQQYMLNVEAEDELSIGNDCLCPEIVPSDRPCIACEARAHLRAK